MNDQFIDEYRDLKRRVQNKIREYQSIIKQPHVSRAHYASKNCQSLTQLQTLYKRSMCQKKKQIENINLQQPSRISQSNLYSSGSRVNLPKTMTNGCIYLNPEINRITQKRQNKVYKDKSISCDLLNESSQSSSKSLSSTSKSRFKRKNRKKQLIFSKKNEMIDLNDYYLIKKQKTNEQQGQSIKSRSQQSKVITNIKSMINEKNITNSSSQSTNNEQKDHPKKYIYTSSIYYKP